MDETLVHCSLDPFIGFQEIVHVTHNMGGTSSTSSSSGNNNDAEMNDSQTTLQVYLIKVQFL